MSIEFEIRHRTLCIDEYAEYDGNPAFSDTELIETLSELFRDAGVEEGKFVISFYPHERNFLFRNRKASIGGVQKHVDGYTFCMAIRGKYSQKAGYCFVSMVDGSRFLVKQVRQQVFEFVKRLHERQRQALKSPLETKLDDVEACVKRCEQMLVEVLACVRK